MVRPATACEFEALQKIEVSEAHVPEKTWKRIFARAPPTVIVGLTVCAVKLYQTSGLVALQAPIEMLVELVKVPFVVTHVGPEVNVTAPVQSSLAGASTTQILKFPLIDVGALVEYTLT